MGTDGACGLLFCAAKRSGAFPPNMPAGLRASRSRSSPILMGLWSEQCSDFTKVLIATGRARLHHQQCKG